MEYVNIFQGDFIMVANAFLSVASKFLGSGASHQQSIPRTEKSVPNAVVHGTSPQELTQLHAPDKIETATSTAAITHEVLQNAAPLTATNQPEIKPPAIRLEISQKTVDDLKPILLKAVNGLKAILPFIAAEIKTILPKSEVDTIFSKIIENNGGSKAAQQWLETRLKNNPLLAQANTQAATVPTPA